MAAGSVDGMFRNIFEGCISSCDAAIERRPYHKNCRCALHEKSRGADSKSSSCRHGRYSSEVVRFPIRRSWSEGNTMSLHLASSSSSSSLHSLSSISTLASLSPTSTTPTMSNNDSPFRI